MTTIRSREKRQGPRASSARRQPRRGRATLAFLLIGTALLPGAGGTPSGACDAEPVGFGIIQLTGGSADTTYYLDDRSPSPFANGEWLYAESNGVWTPKPAGIYPLATNWPGLDFDLTRGGTAALLGREEVCRDLGTPDQLILGV